jgi:hypothetical protein
VDGRVLGADDEAAAVDEDHDRRTRGLARRPDVEPQVIAVAAIAPGADQGDDVETGNGLIRCGAAGPGEFASKGSVQAAGGSGRQKRRGGAA